MITAGATEKELARFWAKVEKRGPDECWSWTAAVSNHGTPVLYWVDKNYTVMRVMWELEYGEAAPSGRMLYRTCGTLGCVNPGHWKLRGSGQDAHQHSGQDAHQHSGQDADSTGEDRPNIFDLAWSVGYDLVLLTNGRYRVVRIEDCKMASPWRLAVGEGA